MRIVQVTIENFRGIRSLLDWNPAPGLNCLIGPGDSTKTTILDALELCLNLLAAREYTDQQLAGARKILAELEESRRKRILEWEPAE